MRVMDGLMAFPSILLAIAIMAALGPRLSNVVLALGIVYAPRTARICRGVVLVTRELGYVEAAVAAAATDFRILRKHILPNCIQAVAVQATFVFAYAILAEAALSFLGVGVPPDVPSWGAIISEGRNYMQIAPWLTLAPGIVIMLAVMGLNLLGDGLRDLLDPNLRQ
jgi:peptide/nickel transport system permease protein